MSIDLMDPTPLYAQIVSIIKGRVERGIYKPGDRLPSQRALAVQFDVSLITVKKAISRLINDGVMYSRVGKGTFVTAHPKRTKLKEHKTIGLVLTDLKSPYFSLIVHSVEKESSNHNFNLLISNTSGKFEKEEHQIQRAIDMEVDGLIIASMSHDYKADATIRQLHQDDYPYVVVSYILDKDIHHVGTDHEAGAYIATKHLIQHGYEKIGYVSGEKGNILGEIRGIGFERALHENGMQPDENYRFNYPFAGEWNDRKSGYEIGKRFLSMDDKPEALFIYNDLGALGFEDAVTEQGMRIPEDIALVAFDDIEPSAYCTVPLTTIRQPTEKIGMHAVKKLMDLISGYGIDTKTIMEPRLVVRDSCGVHP